MGVVEPVLYGERRAEHDLLTGIPAEIGLGFRDQQVDLSLSVRFQALKGVATTRWLDGVDGRIQRKAPPRRRVSVGPQISATSIGASSRTHRGKIHGERHRASRNG